MLVHGLSGREVLQRLIDGNRARVKATRREHETVGWQSISKA